MVLLGINTNSSLGSRVSGKISHRLEKLSFAI